MRPHKRVPEHRKEVPEQQKRVPECHTKRALDLELLVQRLEKASGVVPQGDLQQVGTLAQPFLQPFGLSL